MKAIQIKQVPETDTKPRRLKAWSDSGSLLEPMSYDMDPEMQALLLAGKYVTEVWKNTVTVNGFGVLPNGDWVCTVS